MMGYIRHHAIIVTGTYGDWIDRAHNKANKLFAEKQVSPILEPSINATRSFFIGPDGSKEGWDDSDTGDKQRKKFIQWLNEQRYDDHSSLLSWAEVLYGDDAGECSIVHHDKEKP